MASMHVRKHVIERGELRPGGVAILNERKHNQARFVEERTYGPRIRETMEDEVIHRASYRAFHVPEEFW